MECKEDDTCDQPATKGDIEQVRSEIWFVGFLVVIFYTTLYFKD